MKDKSFIDTLKEKFQKTTSKASKNIKSRFKRKKKSSGSDKKSIKDIYKEYLEKVHWDVKATTIHKAIIKIAIGLGLIVFVSSTFYSLIIGSFLENYVFFTFGLTFTVVSVTYLVLTLALLIYFDLRIRQKTKEIEEALPDFLQITSSNISAGMPIDRALWFAVRPKFGALATEMETIAKSVIAGEDLQDGLRQFSDKYDSQVLKETMSLIIEGINSGGELGDLLNKISENISENKILKKEISANVATYAIFIGAASVFAAPLLLALSTQLLRVIKNITSEIEIDSSGGGFFSFDLGEDGINIVDFEIFSMVILTITAFFSAAIISAIRKGSVKDGFKLIPAFIVVSLFIYFVSNMGFEYLMGGIF